MDPTVPASPAETETGKELQRVPLFDNPANVERTGLKVNCANPTGLLESELLAH